MEKLTGSSVCRGKVQPKILGAMIVLGKSLKPDGSPTGSTIERAETAAKAYKANPKAYGRVIASGLCQREFPVENLPVGVSEGEYQREVLIRRGVPEDIIRVDNLSRTTFANAYNPAMLGFYEGVAFDEEHPLALVAGYPHIIRAGLSLRKVVGVPNSQFRRIISPGETDPSTFIRESIGILATRLALRGVSTGDYNGVELAEQRFHNIVGIVRGQEEVEPLPSSEMA